jgi:steroid delta-isomerase-like uncharacterized protein
MTREDVESIDDRGIAAWDTHDAKAFTELLADDFVWTDITMPEPMRTKDQAMEYTEAWFTAFPDMSLVRTNRVVGDDMVGGEIEFTGTNTGPMRMGGMYIPPTGLSVHGKGAYFAQVSNGRIRRFSTYPDVAGLMMQLGLMPQP